MSYNIHAISLLAEESRQRISSSSSQDDISSGSLQPSRGKKKKTSDADKSNARLFSKSTVLKLLAELTKSYPIVARLISDHLYTSKGNEKASKVQSCNSLSVKAIKITI